MQTHARLAGLLTVCLLISCGTEGSTESSTDLTPVGVDTARNLPADDKVAFILGQDSTTLAEFEGSVLANEEQADFPAPAGVTLYTGILPTSLHPNTAPEDATFYIGGIEGPPVNEASGDVDFHATLEAYDAHNDGEPVALAVGLHLSDSWNNCINQPLRALNATGDPDVGDVSDPGSMAYQWRYAIDRMIKWFDEQDRPVFLRIGYEFDGPWNCHNQEFYIGAFRYIKQRIDELGAEKVATVWQAATYPNDGDPQYHFDASGGPNVGDRAQAIQDHYSDWYPGSEYVDWVGISFFYGARYAEYPWSCTDESRPGTVAHVSPRSLQDALAEFARRHGKPLMIAESAPQGVSVSEMTWSCVHTRQDHLDGHAFDSGGEIWDAYYDDYFSWIETNRDVVRVFAYINTNWQAQSMWTCAPEADTCPSGYWGDHRIQANAELLDRFKTKVQEELYRVRAFNAGIATDTLPAEDGE